LAHWIGVQGLSNLVKKNETPQLCEPLPGEPLIQIKKNFFNRTKKSCRIRKGFEQLSNYSGWRVITKKTRANLLARAVVKGLWWFATKLYHGWISTIKSSNEIHENCHPRYEELVAPLKKNIG